MSSVISQYQILDFVQVSASGLDMWAIEPTNNYAKDCKRGREAAIDLYRAMDSEQLPAIALGTVSRAIICKGRYGGLEVGFFQGLSEILCN